MNTSAAIISTKDVEAIAREAYIYGAPMEDFYRVMYAFSVAKGNPEYKGPFNTVLNVARVFTPDDKAFVTPNSDTPYTFMGLDLRAGPVMITVPAMEPSRYFVLQLMDQYTYNFAYIGTRTTGNDGGHFLVVGPDWHGESPEGMTAVIRSETELVSIVGRTQLFRPDDLDRVKWIQLGYGVRPLTSAALGISADTTQWMRPLPPEAQRTSLEFFAVLNFILGFCPPVTAEIELRARFARMGIEGGKPFDAESLDQSTQEALLAGLRSGQAAIDHRRKEVGSDISRLFGTRAFLGDDYLARAVGAQVGIGANSREEALYPIYVNDADGKTLDGTDAWYSIRFEPGSLPPVNAFWSLTLYGMPDQLLVANPLGRYLINSPMLENLLHDADGGLTIDVSTAARPGREANWLPAPRGAFMLALRFYLPKPELLDGRWKSPLPEKHAR